MSIPDSWIIILFLLHERVQGSSSFWFPYIDLLPEEIDNALYFTEEEAALLDGTTLADQLRVATRDLERLATWAQGIWSGKQAAFPRESYNVQALR